MPGKIYLLAILSIVVLLTACKKDDAPETKRKFISFKLSDSVMLSEQRNSAYYMPGDVRDSDPSNDYSQLLIAGYTSGQDVVNLRLYSEGPEISPGVYSNAFGGTAMFLEMKKNSDVLQADEDFGNITIILHQMQDSVAIGQFSATLVSQTDGSIQAVKDGYFKVIYKKYP